MSDPVTHPDPQALPPQAQILQMATGFLISRALYVVAALNIADHLKEDGKNSEQLAKLTNSHAPSLYRVMRTLAGLGVFAEDENHRFGLTPLGATLRTDDPSRVRSAVLLFGGSVQWQAFAEFPHSVKTGETGVEKVFGMPLFDYLEGHPDEAALFNEAMIGIHGAEPAAVAAAYDFAGIHALVDVGGGTGNLLTTILGANPGLRGALYDLPHVAQEAARTIEAKGLKDRCRVLEGNFFESVPEGFDTYLLSHIIHDWDEDECVTILDNCRRAMNNRGRLLLIEMVIPPGNVPHPGKMLDLVMLAIPGGRERTEEEYAALFAKAGLELTRIVPTSSPVSVVESVPA